VREQRRLHGGGVAGIERPGPDLALEGLHCLSRRGQVRADAVLHAPAGGHAQGVGSPDDGTPRTGQDHGEQGREQQRQPRHHEGEHLSEAEAPGHPRGI